MSTATVQMLDAVYTAYQQSMPLGAAVQFRSDAGAFAGARAPAFAQVTHQHSEARAQSLQATIPGYDQLSNREREAVTLLSSGYRLPHIAEQMGISQHTARNHLKSVFSKLDIHSQGELVSKVRGTMA